MPAGPSFAIRKAASSMAPAAPREHLAATCRRLGWSYLVHRTDRPETEPLLALHARLSDRSIAGGAV